MAPPGTFFQAPQPVPASQPVDLDDDNLEIDISSEDELKVSRSDIRPTSFTSGTRPSTARVEDSPKRLTASFDSSRFMYTPNLKRPNEDPYDVSRKQARPLQTGPARAIPVVDDDLTLDDIPDMELKQKTEAMLSTIGKDNVSVSDCYTSLIACHGVMPLALKTVVQAGKVRNPAAVASRINWQPTETKATPLPPKPTVKRTAQTNKQSLYERWAAKERAESAESSARSTPQPESDQGAKSRRLVRGRRNRSPSSSPVKEVAVINIESDEDDADADGTEPEQSGDDANLAFDDRLLKFFNNCSVQNLSDLSNQNDDVSNLIISKRPFPHLDAVREVKVETAASASTIAKKGRGGGTRAKAIGEKVVDLCYDMLQGFDAVDALVTDCEAKGKLIDQGMRKWGVNIFGNINDGEVEITNFDDLIDSGIGTPSADEDVADADLKHDGIKRRNTRGSLIKKPSIMSESLVLKDYQIVGLNWLKLLWDLGLSAILADDMGLGKTCQVISFLSHLYEKDLEDERLGINPEERSGPHLIVVPGSTLENWMREFQNFSPELSVIPYYGGQKERPYLRDTIQRDARKGKVQVVVTTYDMATKPADRGFLQELGIRACIFDEGHMLKNSQSKRYQELMKIGKGAKFRLLLTGTPLQNNLQELTSLLAFISPGTFKNHKDELESIFKHKAKTTDKDHSALLSVQRTRRARLMMAPFILRRKKAQVLKHLPKKTCRVEYCQLVPAQAAIYNGLKAQQRKVLEDRAAGIQNKDHANVLMKLRQAAIHSLLHRKVYPDEKLRKMAKALSKDPSLPTYPNAEADLVFDELVFYNDFSLFQMCEKYPKSLSKYQGAIAEKVMDSGKVQKFAELLKRFKSNGDRTLVFSQFTQVMDILERVMEKLDITFMRIDGSTPIADRQSMLDTFTADDSIHVFMLSTKSGGAGINLAAANKVIIFDSSFNPQDDIQAENRAHRVGQTREVEVIRLVTRGTIEEQIYALGISKLELDAMVAGDEESKRLEAQGEDLVEQMLLEQMQQEDKEGPKEQPEVNTEGEAEAALDNESNSSELSSAEDDPEEPDKSPEPEPEPRSQKTKRGRLTRGRRPSPDQVEDEPANPSRRRGRLSRTTSSQKTDEPSSQVSRKSSGKESSSQKRSKPAASSAKKGNKDLKEMFLTGLKKKGLDMSAA